VTVGLKAHRHIQLDAMSQPYRGHRTVSDGRSVESNTHIQVKAQINPCMYASRLLHSAVSAVRDIDSQALFAWNIGKHRHRSSV
jgi:hypothetical protein